jgi:hypothetical protein
MGKLEEQLRRAERKAAPPKEKPKGGPMEGEPDDRWLAWHSTMIARNLAVLLTLLALILGGVPAVGTAWAREWTIAMLAGGATLAVIAISWGVYFVKSSKAPARQRLYVATLPFKLEGYLETLREPRWWAKMSWAVVYKPTLTVTWMEPPGDATVEKLATLAKARFDNGTFAPTSWSVADPWAWTRDVIEEVLLPLREKSEVQTAMMRVTREVEYQSNGD